MTSNKFFNYEPNETEAIIGCYHYYVQEIFWCRPSSLAACRPRTINLAIPEI